MTGSIVNLSVFTKNGPLGSNRAAFTRTATLLHGNLSEAPGPLGPCDPLRVGQVSNNLPAAMATSFDADGHVQLLAPPFRTDAGVILQFPIVATLAAGNAVDRPAEGWLVIRAVVAFLIGFGTIVLVFEIHAGGYSHFRWLPCPIFLVAPFTDGAASQGRFIGLALLILPVFRAV